MLASSGADAVCLNGGGDIQLYGGGRPGGWASRDPLHPGGLLTVIEADERPRRRHLGPAERGCHILDPHTRRPPAGALASMTVVCPGLTHADARATAAYAMGGRARDWLEELPGAEAFAVTAEGTTWSTNGWRRYG